MHEDNIFHRFRAVSRTVQAVRLPAVVLVVLVPALVSHRSIKTDFDGALPACGRVLVNGAPRTGAAVVSIDEASTGVARSHVLVAVAAGARTKAIRFTDVWLAARPLVVSDEGIRCRAR